MSVIARARARRSPAIIESTRAPAALSGAEEAADFFMRGEGRSGQGLAAHLEELLAAPGAQQGAVLTDQFAQIARDCFTDRLYGARAVAMGAAQRLGNDRVDDAELLQVLRGDAKRFRGVLGLLGTPPQDRCAAF